MRAMNDKSNPKSLIYRARTSLANIINPSTSSPQPATNVRAGNATPYDGGSSSRRAYGWNPSRLGPTSSIFVSADKVLARSRDQVRNHPWATSAVDNYESQVISTGIRPRWKLKNKSRRELIERTFNQWANQCDYYGQLSFWGLQAQMAREVCEAGESFSRFYVRPSSFKMKVPLQIQLIESEQLPFFKNDPTGERPIRTGIEFDSYGRRTAYHFYNVHPGDTSFYPSAGLQFSRVPAEDVIHVYRPLRSGQLRGTSHLSSVLTLLYELEQYTDAELARKKVQAMWAAFITKTNLDTDVIPISDKPTSSQSGIENTQLEPGSINELLPGEDIKFPSLPPDMDFASFLKVEGHRFAVGCGMTYEQLTGDLSGVTYSSIRAGILDFRRKCELLQFNIFVHQFCQPLVKRWLKEAFLSGALDLPGYATDPEKYEDIMWTPSGWDWVDPLKDVQAEVTAIRAGLSTRSHSIAQRGKDAAVLDEEWKADKERQDEMGLVYDTDPAKILFKAKSNPTDPVLLDEADKDRGTVSNGEEDGNKPADGSNGIRTSPPIRSAKLFNLLP